MTSLSLDKYPEMELLDHMVVLEVEIAIHSGILAWRIPWTEEPAGGATVHGVTKSRTGLRYSHTHVAVLVLIF